MTLAAFTAAFTAGTTGTAGTVSRKFLLRRWDLTDGGNCLFTDTDTTAAAAIVISGELVNNPFLTASRLLFRSIFVVIFENLIVHDFDRLVFCLGSCSDLQVFKFLGSSL